jgi:hypothetical protein
MIWFFWALIALVMVLSGRRELRFLGWFFFGASAAIAVLNLIQLGRVIP